MNYRTISAFCIAIVMAISSLIPVYGQSTDSLLQLLYNDLVREEADKYELLCEIASNSDDADTILKYSEQAIQLAEKLDINTANPTILKGTGYLNSGQLAPALECFIKAANIYQADNNNFGLARAYNYIAETYNLQENPDNEKYYLNSAIEIYRKENDSINLAITLHNLGYANYSNGQYDTALIIYSETSELFKELGYLRQYAYCLGNSGLAYSRLSEFDQAEDCLLDAIEILTEQGDIYAVTQYTIEYAVILQHRGEIEKALENATISFGNAVQYGFIEYERDAAERLAQLYQTSGRYDSAYHYLLLYIRANDSIKSDENIQKMADMRTEFEVAKKQTEVDLLQKDKTIQRIVIAGLILILLLAVGLIMLYYYSLKQSKKLTASLEERRILLEKREHELQEVNTLLEEQKEELMQQKEELQSTLENLQKTQEQLVESEKMAAVGGLVAGVAHEMNTPVGVGITAISNLEDDIQKITGLYEKDKISREDFKGFLDSTNEIAKLIQKNLKKAASLIQSFIQVSTDQVTEQQRVFALREYLYDILASLKPKFRDKKIDVKVECDDELKLNSYPGVYAQIFTNFLINSLQHGFYDREKGLIFIKADMNKDLLQIRYSDDGAGINKKDLPHIFEPFYTSDHQLGTGLGLNIIYNLVKQKLHGTIACESEEGKGAVFIIEVPVK